MCLFSLVLAKNNSNSIFEIKVFTLIIAYTKLRFSLINCKLYKQNKGVTSRLYVCLMQETLATVTNRKAMTTQYNSNGKGKHCQLTQTL